MPPGPDLREIYRLEKENNQMLRSMKRNAFWGGVLKVGLFLFALGVPLWLYFSYVAPVIKQFDATLSAATGQKVQIEGKLAEWAKMWEEFRAKFTGAPTSTPKQ